MAYDATNRSAAVRGAILLEVVLALVTFAGVAGVILSGLSASVQSAAKLEQQTRASDLLATLSSELEMGLIEPVDAGPVAYDEPLLGWSWSVTASELGDVIEGPAMRRVTLEVSNPAESIVRRLVHLVVLPDPEAN